MKTLKIISITILLLTVINITSIKAQKDSVTQHFLMNKKWHMYEKTDHVLIDKYGKKTVTSLFDDLFVGEMYYYLSDKEETVFDMSKVGNSKKGKYIVCKAKGVKTDSITVLEIIEAEGKKLVLQNVKQVHLLKYKEIE